jgi:hypothetical protein
VVDVALIVTGDMEQYGLGRALQKDFPQVSFTVQKVDCFTSANLGQHSPGLPRVKTAIQKYATALVAALDPGRRECKPHYVFGIEDLELANSHQPAVVIQALRSAVAAELATRRARMNANSYAKLEARLRDQCSFHLFVPMIEAYLFADAAALAATGCTRRPQLLPGCDVEQFQSIDPAYLQPPVQPPHPWAINPNTRPYHPKRYLQFLLAPAFYSETLQGVHALLTINWQTVLANPQETLFLRALFQDLAEAVGLGVQSFPGNTHPLTSDHANPGRVLRNI